MEYYKEWLRLHKQHSFSSQFKAHHESISFKTVICERKKGKGGRGQKRGQKNVA
jgi:hypothetical protein